MHTLVKLKLVRPSAALGAVLAALMLFNAVAAPAPVQPSPVRPGSSHALPLDYQTQIIGQFVRSSAHTLTMRTLHGDRVFAVDKLTQVTPQNRGVSSFHRGDVVSAAVERDRSGYLRLTRLALRTSKPLPLMGEAAPTVDDPDKQAHLESDDNSTNQDTSDARRQPSEALDQTAASVDDSTLALAPASQQQEPAVDTVDPVYAEAAASNATLGTCPSGNAAVTGAQFVIGSHAPVTQIGGQVRQGNPISAQFYLANGCADVPVSLVAYTAPAAAFSRTTANQQKIYDSATGAFTSGAAPSTLKVTAPPCYYQVDFVRGAPITQLGPSNSYNFYGDQSRLIQHDNGGTNVCTGVPPITATPTATSTAAPATKTATPTSTSTATATAAATSTATSTATPAATATGTHTSSPTPTATATATTPPTSTSTATATSTSTSTSTATPTSTATSTASPTATATSTATSTPVGVPVNGRDWPQHLFGPDRGGINASAIGSPPSALATPWTAPNQVQSAAVVVDGLVYNTDDNSGQLSARDAKDGRLIWAANLLGSADLAPPAVANGVVYVSASGSIQTFDAKTGVAGWSESDSCANCFGQAPIVLNSILYAPLYDTTTGLTTIRVRGAATGDFKSTLSGIRGKSQVVVSGGKLLEWDTQSGLHAYDISDPTNLRFAWTWTPAAPSLVIKGANAYQMASFSGDISTDPVTNRAYVLYQEPSSGVVPQISLNAIDIGTTNAAALATTISLNEYSYSSAGGVAVGDQPVVFNGALQVVLRAGASADVQAPLKLLQLDPASLQLKSSYAVTTTGGIPVLNSNVTFVTGGHGVLYVANCTSDRAASFSNGFYAIDPSNGDVVWSAPDSLDCPESEIAVADNLVVATDMQQLYAYPAPPR